MTIDCLYFCLDCFPSKVCGFVKKKPRKWNHFKGKFHKQNMLFRLHSWLVCRDAVPPFFFPARLRLRIHTCVACLGVCGVQRVWMVGSTPVSHNIAQSSSVNSVFTLKTVACLAVWIGPRPYRTLVLVLAWMGWHCTWERYFTQILILEPNGYPDTGSGRHT